jgi:hypothetical protein
VCKKVHIHWDELVRRPNCLRARERPHPSHD